MKSKQYIRLFSVATIIFLTGAKSINDQQTIPAGPNLNIVFIGNSITEGSALANAVSNAPPVYAYQYLKKQPDLGKITFSNQGYSGFTTVDFLPSTATAFNLVEKAADSLQKINRGILIFSIKLGTNDSAIEGPLGSPVSPAQYRVNIMAIADRLLKDYPRCKIILHHPLWYSPNTYNGSRYLAEGLQRLQDYFPELDTIVKTYRHTNPQQVFIGDTTAFGYFKKNYLTKLIPEAGNQGTFYLHPNKEGSKVLGQYWGAAIHGIVNKIVRAKK